MAYNIKNYKELIAFHPGSYVEEIIEDLNISQEEFAERLGTTPKTISKLVNGEISLSRDLANKLCKLTGISIVTWLNLQANFDTKVIEIEERQNQEERDICEMIDFNYFKKHGFISEGRYPVEKKIIELRKLFQISNLSYLTQFNHLVSYRNTKGFDEPSIVNSNVMLELAIKLARDADTRFDKKKLEKILPELRAMTLQESGEFYPVLKSKLSECGISLVALPKLKNANLNGATKKFKNGSVLVLLTDRNKSSDIFWFSLFHELGHILHNDFYSDYDDVEGYQEKERKADLFAQELLIKKDDYEVFLSEESFDKSSILQFAQKLELHPSIILGRLQKDGYVSYGSYQELKINYNIVIENC
ncbi:HigA family addiction module antitoxin [Streptococcus danieliae]|uniref:HigA family addiction module antitoxin n=1 Tax=Streptococcus danieliae TaxID=747656 RepID=UPI0021C867B9|nr:HigA family addiction module antitoxin [Streptococcus danieliae]MCU0082111.1 HigA family addiction module antitoxin [Streptococcus danieliae]